MGSHDFIRFPPYEVELTPALLMLLGEVQSKIEQIASMPISPDEHEALKTVYFIRAVHGTTAIEGNTLSEAEVRELLERPRSPATSTQYEEREVRNAIDALNIVAEEVLEGRGDAFSVEWLNRFHRLLVTDSGTPNCEDSEIGVVRQRSVVVGRYQGAPAGDCPRLLAQLCDWLNEPEYAPDGFGDYHPVWQIIKAIIAHIYFAWIHPYCDGNGRMARLIEFKHIFAAGVPDFAAHLFSNMYNKRRSEYVELLQDSHGDYNDGAYPPRADIQRFVEWAVQGFRDELEDQCRYILSVQTTIVFRHMIQSSFPEKLSNAQQRRKQLALDLADPKLTAPVPFREIRQLTPAVAVAYANQKDQTIRNDLNFLRDMKLIERVETGYKPNTDALSILFARSREQ